jgi:signal peptidase I
LTDDTVPADASQADQPVTETKESKGSALWREVKGLAWVLLAVLVFHSFVAKPFYIPSESMMPNLLKGDRLVVSKFPYGWSWVSPSFHILPHWGGRLLGNMPQRGDTVIVTPPGQSDDYIKRVIGLPGDTVELRAKKVYVNGQPLDEPYVHFLTPASDLSEVTSMDVRERYGPVTVPSSQYFVMGDNRDNSQDSRYWGFLPRHYVKGQAMMIYWSYESERDDFAESGVGATVGRLVSVVTHFFTKTRWERLLHQIH